MRCLKDGDEDSKKKHAELQQMRDTAPPEPPSPFSDAVLEYSEKFPSKGAGKKRAQTAPEAMQVASRHTNKTRVAQGTKPVRMHK
eukprot:2159296-Pyramimonas_sp.AAC.1